MYDVSDPRSRLAQSTTAAASAAPPAAGFAAAQFGRFYESEPQESGPAGRTWYTRGQNFIVAYSDAKPRRGLRASGSVRRICRAGAGPGDIDHGHGGGETVSVPGHSLVIVPPGNSQVVVPAGGRIVRLITHAVEGYRRQVRECDRLCDAAAEHPAISGVAGAGRRLSHSRLQPGRSRRRPAASAASSAAPLSW